MRTKDERVAKRALKGYTEGRKPVGRPRGRCLDAVDRDGKRTFIDHCHRAETQLQSINTISYHIIYHITLMKCRNWRRSAENRDAWRWSIEEAKSQVGL
jgi:hypothetical protein